MNIEQINKINAACPYDQGIFREPYGVDKEKDYCIYAKWNSGGYTGGSCWDDNEPYFYEGESEPNFIALDLVIKELCPNISYFQHKDIERLIKTGSDTDYQYYGNSDDYSFKWIVLKDLENYIKKNIKI